MIDSEIDCEIDIEIALSLFVHLSSPHPRLIHTARTFTPALVALWHPPQARPVPAAGSLMAPNTDNGLFGNPEEYNKFTLTLQGQLNSMPWGGMGPQGAKRFRI